MANSIVLPIRKERQIKAGDLITNGLFIYIVSAIENGWFDGTILFHRDAVSTTGHFVGSHHSHIDVDNYSLVENGVQLKIWNE